MTQSLFEVASNAFPPIAIRGQGSADAPNSDDGSPCTIAEVAVVCIPNNIAEHDAVSDAFDVAIGFVQSIQRAMRSSRTRR